MTIFKAGGPLNSNEHCNIIVRRQELNRIINHINNEELYIALNSPRQTGKATLISQIHSLLHGQGYAVVYLDFSGLNDLEKCDFYETMCTDIRDGILDLINNIDERISSQNVNDQKSFVKYLKLLSSNTPEIRKIILIFYGINGIPQEVSLTLFPIIRSFFTKGTTSSLERSLYQKIMFIFAGDIDLMQLMQGQNSPLLNICELFSLKDFSVEQMFELAKNFQGISPKMIETIAKDVYYWTNGHPYLTQVLYELIEQSITYENLDTVQLSEKIKQLSQTNFIYGNNSNLNHIFHFIRKNKKSYCDSVFTVLNDQHLKSVPHDQDLIMIGIFRRSTELYLTIRNNIYREALINFLEQQ